MRKVKAHATISADLSAEQRKDAGGNAAAVEEAKAARALHPGQSDATLNQWARDWSDAMATAALIAAVGPLWPAARPPDGRRLPAPRRRVARRSTRIATKKLARWQGLSSHQWQWSRSRYRCAACGVVRTPHGAATSSCAGRKEWFAKLAADSRGHRLFVADVLRPPDAPTPLTICSQCGAWAEVGRSRALAEEACRGAPSSKHAAAAWQRVCRGQFPKPGKQAQGCTVQCLCPLVEVLEVFHSVGC